MDYSYERLSFRINIRDNNFSIYEPFFNGLRLPDYFNKPNAEELFQNEIGLYHELTHFYQDFFFPACICERDLKNRIVDSVKNHSVQEVNDLKELYEYLFEESQYVETLKELINPNSNKDFWSISYKDLLESYADIRSTKTVMDAYFNKDNQVDQFISNFFINNTSFHFESFENNRKIHTKLGGTTRQYSICKQVFLSLLTFTKSKFLFCDEEPTAEYLKILMADGFRHNKGDFMYNIARRLDIILLYCIEFALTLPSITFIKDAIKDGKSKRMFHPGCRFYYIVTTILGNPDTFNKLDISASYTEVFDIISDTSSDLYKYSDVVNSYLKPNIPFSFVRHQHNRTLIETIQKITIANRCNSDIFGFFKQTGIPVLLWGQGRQQIYVGDGNDKFDILQYYGDTHDYINDYFKTVMVRYLLPKTNSIGEIKKMLSMLFLQESVVYWVINKCANTIIKGNVNNKCPIPCEYNNYDCSVLKTITNDNLNHCLLTKLINFIII